MKRACKLQEFTAHGSVVTCLQLGRKTSGVLVTGGEDKKVNVWALGKPVPQLVEEPLPCPEILAGILIWHAWSSILHLQHI